MVLISREEFQGFRAANVMPRQLILFPGKIMDREQRMICSDAVCAMALISREEWRVLAVIPVIMVLMEQVILRVGMWIMPWMRETAQPPVQKAVVMELITVEGKAV
jgi:hypothetical protein